jgi:excisionase family DNA binding protein
MDATNTHLPQSLRPSVEKSKALSTHNRPKPWYVAEIAEHYRVTQRTVRRWIKTGQLTPSLRVGRRRGFSDYDLDAFETRKGPGRKSDRRVV